MSASEGASLVVVRAMIDSDSYIWKDSEALKEGTLYSTNGYAKDPKDVKYDGRGRCELSHLSPLPSFSLSNLASVSILIPIRGWVSCSSER